MNVFAPMPVAASMRAVVSESSPKRGSAPAGALMIQLQVRSTWARQVAAPGWAVLDGRPVLDVLAWDETVSPRRAARVRTALICADYDAGMHGWRAHADNRDLRVAWSPEGVATLVMPWDEPRDSGVEAVPAG